MYSTWDRPIEVDTAATAWLIRRFVSPAAVFVFEPTGSLRMPGTAFDTPSAEDSRRGNRTVAEYWARKHNLEDPALERLLSVVHDIEINVWQPKATAEAPGLAAVFRGLSEIEPRRPECLMRGMEIIDALYADFARQSRTASPAK